MAALMFYFINNVYDALVNMFWLYKFVNQTYSKPQTTFYLSMHCYMNFNYFNSVEVTLN